MQLAFAFVGENGVSADLEGTEGLNRAAGHATKRVLSGEQMARVLTGLRGGDLLVAALMFGCGLTFHEVMDLSVSDLSVASGTISATGGDKRSSCAFIPSVILEDLKEFLLDRACGREVRGESLERSLFLSNGRKMHEYEAAIKNALSLACKSRAISGDLLLWARSEYTVLCDQHGCSPLDLFEKGPMIVRRTSMSDRATTDRYYLWRYRGAPLARKAPIRGRQQLRRTKRYDQDNPRIQHQFQAAA